MLLNSTDRSKKASLLSREKKSLRAAAAREFYKMEKGYEGTRVMDRTCAEAMKSLNSMEKMIFEVGYHNL